MLIVLLLASDTDCNIIWVCLVCRMHVRAHMRVTPVQAHN